MKIKRKIQLSILIVFHLVLAIFVCSKKENFHMDEFMTYGLSNQQGDIQPVFEYDKQYSGYGAFDGYLEVGESNRFDYINVWKNQSKDVHPPIYYFLVHTVCSIFPESFSMWYGISVNLLCLIVIDILLYYFAKKIFDEDLLAFGALAIYGTSIMYLNMMAFIRMYAVFTCFSIALPLLLINYYNKEKDKKFWILLYAIVTGGVLTHYYFLIYLFFLCMFLGINYIVKKEYQEGIKFVGVLSLAGATCIGFYPYIIKHLFFGSRGKEAIKNIFSLSDFFLKIFGYIKIVNSEVFGGLLIILLLLSAIGLVLKYKEKKKFELSFEFILVSTSILYILVISKIAPMITSRYIAPVCWIYVVCIFNEISKLFKTITKNKIKGINSFVLIVFISVNIITLILIDFATPATYVSERELLENATAYKEDTAIVVCDERWRTLYSVVELAEYKNYYIVKSDDFLNTIDKCSEGNIMLYITDEKHEELIFKTLEETKNFESFDYMLERSSTKIYHLMR